MSTKYDKDFSDTSLEPKIQVLCGYLLSHENGITMEKVGRQVYGKPNQAGRVSNILRQYGFHASALADNPRKSYGGLLGSNNNFADSAYKFDITEDDIRAFVQKYPKGANSYKDFDKFITERHKHDRISNNDNNAEPESWCDEVKNGNYDPYKPRPVRYSEHNSYDNYRHSEHRTDKVDILIAIVICALFVLSIITGWCKNHIVITVVLGIFSVVSVSETIRGLRN